ncbi:MAG: Pr6Pr family membrane protein [Spirochaetales bacterium]|nr:Pr6Pr family membrane protein [Spirochaetales bacterium]
MSFDKNMRTIRVVAHLALAALAIAGSAIEIALPVAWSDSAGMLRYFTIQANFLVAAVSLAEAARAAAGLRPGRLLSLARGMALMGIALTGLVFGLFLAPLWRPAGLLGVANAIVHGWVPVLSFLVWAALDAKGRFRRSDAFAWTLFPLAYLAWSLAYGAASGFYPYWFLDPSSPPPEGMGSAAGVAAFSAIASALYLALGFALVAADGALARVEGPALARWIAGAFRSVFMQGGAKESE